MSTDTRTPDEIERDIERERSALTHTLDDLQSRFSVESITRQLGDQIRTHGGEIGRSVADAVSRNPMAVALTGVGLAWLMLGDGPRLGRSQRSGRSAHDHSDDYDRIGSPGVPGGRTTTASHAQHRPLGSAASDPRPAAARHAPPSQVPSWARPVETSHDEHPGAATRLRDAASHAGDSASSAASSAAGAANRAGSRVGDSVRGATAAVSGAGRSAAEGARNAAASASERAAAFRARLAEGTESLSEEARSRVIAARERAVLARDAAMSYGRRGRERAADMFEEQPLIAGALALAIGAAIGAALPRSRTEDRYLGDYSDGLIEEAERIYEEEKAKLSQVARAATDEAHKIAEETRRAANESAPADTAAQGAVEAAKSSGKRVADAAEKEAKKQNLGDVKKS